MKKKILYRVVLQFPLGISHSVFYKSHNRESAEQMALRKNPHCIGINRGRFPQN